MHLHRRAYRWRIRPAVAVPAFLIVAAWAGAAAGPLAPLDRRMEGFVARHRVPGAALAVTRSGRLAYARGRSTPSLSTWDRMAPMPTLEASTVRMNSN